MYTDAHLIFKDYQTKTSVYVGNMRAASDQSFFHDAHIGAVVNATPDVPFTFYDKGVSYIRLVVDDSGRDRDMDIMYQAFPNITNWMNKQMKSGRNILIHCHAGVQRSASIAAAYMIRYYRRPLSFVLHHIVSNRPIAFSFGRNVNFLKPLQQYAHDLGVDS